MKESFDQIATTPNESEIFRQNETFTNLPNPIIIPVSRVGQFDYGVFGFFQIISRRFQLQHDLVAIFCQLFNFRFVWFEETFILGL